MFGSMYNERWNKSVTVYIVFVSESCVSMRVMWRRDKHQSNFLWRRDPKNRGDSVVPASSYFNINPTNFKSCSVLHQSFIVSRETPQQMEEGEGGIPVLESRMRFSKQMYDVQWQAV